MAPDNALELLSCISSDGLLRLTLEAFTPGPLDDDEVLVEIHAAPVHPSDQRVLLGPVDTSTLRRVDTATGPSVEGRVPPAAMASVDARLDRKLPVGAEGAGVVIDAGKRATHLMGRRVGFRTTSGAYATHRVVRADDCIVVDDGVPFAAAAGAFLNPLTVLCMVRTLRRDGHRALVHAPAASALGQMLNRLCLADDIGLVNVVRSPAQVALLEGQGATHVVDSSAPDFVARLDDAIAATGATAAFDAIGGGTMASTMLASMERAQRARMTAFSPYGSPVLKQVYSYGLLDPSPRVIGLDVGTAWSIRGWLMAWELAALDSDTVTGFRTRIAQDLASIFATDYKAALGFDALLTPAALQAMALRSTQSKVLVEPNGPAGSA